MGSFWSVENDEDNISSQSFDPKRLNNPGVTVLKEILKTIKLDEKLKKENNEILHNFLYSFIDCMKMRDALFNSLFNKIYYTGSYYSDLRISQPDEFDINIVLKLPFSSKDFEIEYHHQVPSYAICKLKNPSNFSHPNHEKILNKFFGNGALLVEKVRRWMQSVVDNARKIYKLPKGIVNIKSSASGPARTLQLIKRDGSVIDIDLVPVIFYTVDTKMYKMDGRIANKVGNTIEAFLVPKPFSAESGKQLSFKPALIPYLWRTHYPTAESQLIADMGCVKPIIKLLKLLRDKENFKILASYYLKTVVMWMILENNSKEFWKEDRMYLLFILALEKLCCYVEQTNIPYLFNKKHNLISKLTPYHAIQIQNRLRGILKRIKSNPMDIFSVFGITPTFTLPK